MLYPFEKWHGCSNDFIVTWIDKRNDQLFESIKRQSKKLCSRKGKGIGADGILILRVENTQVTTPEDLVIINSDGTLASTCGNGLRCASASVLKKNFYQPAKGFTQLEPFNEVELKVGSSSFLCQVITKPSGDFTDERLLIAVDMGPVLVDEECDFYKSAQIEVLDLVKKANLEIQTSQVHGATLTNQHIVILDSELEHNAVFRLGPQIQNSKHWDGINFHIASTQILDAKLKAQYSQWFGSKVEDSIAATVWERGAGATQACGSGACAIVATAIHDTQMPAGQWIHVQMPGGALFVRYDSGERRCTLAGNAQLVFEGSFAI